MLTSERRWVKDKRELFSLVLHFFVNLKLFEKEGLNLFLTIMQTNIKYYN